MRDKGIIQESTLPLILSDLNKRPGRESGVELCLQLFVSVALPHVDSELLLYDSPTQALQRDLYSASVQFCIGL